ncbi:MAG: acyl-CoA thioesterase [Bacteroidetes bacterium]|nr:acyl-CoA thioesterase [Bacteroidota bacterium]
MIQSEKKIRIRYDEVDKMGYVYHGNYAKYFHVSRTHLLRKLGICDKTLEKQHIIMPVIEMNIQYLKPVHYDDLIKIETTFKELTGIRLKFDHIVYNPGGEIINKAQSTLAFVNSNTHRAIRIPDKIFNKLKTISN